ncbi:hypothetical protein I8752_29290 [Nostocaceae cyanobacterium CENA369]|uniref:Uncharacterized protein n=1 Tax=Dendronalium phyllosphericum CENA369 TaxID=1725256 RepID=A0A8J7I6J4_9NOST|nr:hypothetical protein [Dendronalium phyllosphericum]MBH8577005.1 hypothetical protein [Dendronalium phyllosphericum CENA369]
MSDQQTTDKATTNGRITPTNSLKGRKKQWKSLAVDPLAEGFDGHQAEYVVGKSPLTWATLQPGQLFSRSKSGKNLHVKLNDGRAICLDTRQPIEFEPRIRNTQQVWLVTSFNSTTANKADF